MLLDKLFGRSKSLDPAPSDDYWYMSTGRQVASGVRVDENAALNYSAVWCATRAIVEPTATVPFPLFRRRPGGKGKDRATDHPTYTLIHDAPNPEMSSMTFREALTAAQVNWGNGYAEIERTRGGRPVAMWPIHPSRMKVKRDRQRRLGYYVTNDDNSITKLEPENVFHVAGVLSDDGITGKGVITFARESVGMGLATESYGAAFFGNSAVPNGVLTTPQKLNDVALKNLRESWQNIHGGPSNSSRLGILEQGLEYKAIGINSRDAQFLETRQHNLTEIARWYRVSPHLLMDLTRATFANIEHLSLEYVVYTLARWFKSWQHEVWRKLLSREERPWYFAEFLVAELLRGDAKARADANSIRAQNGAISIDEWREEEGNNPLPDGLGQQHYRQLNLVEVGKEPEPTAAPAKPASPDAASKTPAPEAVQAEPMAFLEVPDIRQEDNYSCGAACAMSVGQYFGVGPDNLEEWKAALDTTPGNATRPMAIVEYLTELGLTVTSGNGLTLDDLREFWRKGQPVICPIQAYGPASMQDADLHGHYVVVIGAAFGYVFVQDPSISNALEGDGAPQAPGRSMISEADWMAAWHDEDVDGKKYVQFGVAAIQKEPDRPDGQAADPGEEDAPTGAGSGEADSKQKGDGAQPESPAVTGGLSVKAAAMGILADTAARMLRKEANEARRAAEKPGGFSEWLETFYAKHLATIAQAVRPAITACLAADNDSRDPEAVSRAYAAAHVALSRAELTTTAKITPDRPLIDLSSLSDSRTASNG